MDFDLSGIELKESEIDLEVFINKVVSGKALLFTGAGFSSGCTAHNESEPPSASVLSSEISKLASIDENNNLAFTSDYFLSNNRPDALLNLLRDSYTITKVSEMHKTICALDWHRFYTTNYDNSIELASQENSKLVETIDIEHPTNEYYKRGNLCIHLNGSINSLTTDSLGNSFKLSSSSYLSADSFINSDWYYYFKRDLERVSAIVFVGYSMYDIDVQKILKTDDDLKKKTYFITRPNPSLETKFSLQRFGNVLPIGVEGFADLITKNKELIEDKGKQYSLESLALYELSGNDVDIRDSDVEKMLMYGDFSHEVIENYVLSSMSKPMLVTRDCVHQIYSLVDKNRNVILFGSLGNGKTIILNELKVFLTVNGLKVYELDDSDGDYISDVDLLSRNNDKTVILLDDYESYIDLIEHVSRSGLDNIVFVSTARTADHEYLSGQLSEFGFDYSDINIDTLSDGELQDFSDIVDNLGLWKDEAGLSTSQKIRKFKSQNESQVSSILISLLNSPNIKTKITELVGQLKTNAKYSRTLLAISLCKILDIKADKSIISEISGNDSIYEPDFFNNNSFKHLFHVERGEVVSGSAIFAIHVIKENFTASFITDSCLKIAERFNSLSDKDYTQQKVFKSMLKFSFIERILPKSAKVGNMNKYYEALKVSIPWLRYDPHYWLQYAMSYMGFRNYSKAQDFLDQAYSLAANKNNYYTDNIDTQQARLWLLSSDNISDGKIVYSNFKKAHELLLRLQDDTYKLRQINGYKDFYVANNSKLSKENKEEFKKTCLGLKDYILNHSNDFNSAYKVTKTIGILESITT